MADTVEARILLAARLAHEANRFHCQLHGDHSQLAWDDAPAWQQDSAVVGVRTIITNPAISSRQLHEAWMRDKVVDGWAYGPVKDVSSKVHPCLVDYAELPEAQRMKDAIFGAVVRAVLAGGVGAVDGL